MIIENGLVLHRGNVILHMLEESHVKQLTALATEKQIWQYAPESFHEPDIFREKWFNNAITQIHRKERVGFVIFLENKMAGSSSYYDIDVGNKKLKIGYTWFHPFFWGSNLNAISKLILLDHVFNHLMFNRAEFCVDSINLRSCHALQKLGIKQEGILRNHLLLSNGRIRHSAIFSVIREEWPENKKYIEKKAGLL